jgi:hypothetical protein
MATPTKKFIMNNQTHQQADKLLYKLHMANTLEKRVDALQQMKLNRDLLLLPLTIMADCSSSYCSAITNGNEGLDCIRRQLKVRDMFEDLTLPMLKVKYNVDSYLRARHLILQKYYRLVVKHIGEIRHVIKENRISTNDMAVEYELALLKAFAKFDITSGPFTSYLKNSWFKNARSTSLKIDGMGIAFTIPSEKRKAIATDKNNTLVNFSVGLDDLDESMTDPDNVINYKQSSDDEAVRQIIEMYDVGGLYRLLNDIELHVDPN